MSEFEKHIDEKDQKFGKSMLVGEDVSRHLTRQAALVFKYGHMLAAVEDNYERNKFRLDNLKRQLKKSFRNADKVAKIKSTETQLDERAETHSQYVEAHSNYLDAKLLVAKVKAKYKAQLVFGDMAVQLSQMRRKEFDAGIRSTLKQS